MAPLFEFSLYYLSHFSDIALNNSSEDNRTKNLIT